MSNGMQDMKFVCHIRQWYGNFRIIIYLILPSFQLQVWYIMNGFVSYMKRTKKIYRAWKRHADCTQKKCLKLVFQFRLFIFCFPKKLCLLFKSFKISFKTSFQNIIPKYHLTTLSFPIQIEVSKTLWYMN